jgi:endoglucanase
VRGQFFAGGTCAGSDECTPQQQCAACLPVCDGKSCGDDTCGGSCGACLDGDVCGADRSCHSYLSMGGPPRLHVDDTVLRGVALIDLASASLGRTGGVVAAIDRLTAPGWATAVVRFPVYTTTTSPLPFPLGDHAQREEYMSTILRPAVDYATRKGLYVIVDLHEISNVTPQMDRDAQSFWRYMAGQFASYPNVIYELFNEPIDSDGAYVAGTTDACWPPFKAKAEGWIGIVRQLAPESLLLLGGPSWSQVIGPAADDPVSDLNVAYVGHIYPMHIPGGAVQAQLTRCAAVHPVVLTEWGYETTDDPTYVDVMRALIETNRLSWTSWVADYDWKPPMYTGAGELTPFGATVQNWLSAPVPP